MKRIVWLTDIHLNFLPETGVPAFLAEVALARPDAVLVGGDIGEAHNVCDYLGQIGEALAVPIYFVLGNHDFYFGSIRETRNRVAKLCGHTHGQGEAQPRQNPQVITGGAKYGAPAIASTFEFD